MQFEKKTPVERLLISGFGVTLAVLLLTGGLIWNDSLDHGAELRLIGVGVLMLSAFLVAIYARIHWMIGHRGSVVFSKEPLLKADALQDAIFKSANFSSIATDAQGVIQIFNVGAERMLGYQASEVVNQITPAGISDAQEVVARAAALSVELDTPITPGFEALAFKASRGIEDIYELTYIRKDGSRVPAIVSVSALRDAQDKVIGYLMMGTDNTARKRVEAEQALLDERLREQQHALQETNVELEHARAAAEKANLAKSEFLSSMSHELRTPLNAVLGFAQLLASGQPPPTPSQQRSLDQILKGGWYLLRLINEILDLAMIESGKVVMSQESMGLSDVLRDCQAMIAPQAQKRGIDMRFSSLDRPFFVHADRTRVKQVMINLLSNAIKYNRRGGEVTVRLTAGPDVVCLAILDNGIGMTPSQLQNLFQPFNRLGREASATEGTGIGLVITRNLVQMMGGELAVRSSADVGSEFVITLPAGASAGVSEDCLSEVQQRSPLARGGDNRQVLYVDDDEVNLVLMEAFLAQRPDIALRTLRDGASSVGLALEVRPRLMLIDLMMPGMDGLAVMRAVRADRSLDATRCIAVSANAMPNEIDLAIAAGFDGYLTKPISLQTLLAEIDRWL